MEDKKERTLVLIKPDAYASGNTLSIEAAYRKAGLVDIAGGEISPRRHNIRKLVEAHYAEIGGEAHDEIVDFVSSDVITVLVFAGDNAVERVLKVTGPTDPSEAEEGTIRNRFGTDRLRNAVEVSASPEAAEREIAIWFPSLSRKNE